MIKYALLCEHDHASESWFSGSAAYEKLEAANMLRCPLCGSTKMRKAPMAPAVTSSAHRSVSEEVGKTQKTLAKVKNFIEEHFEDVGTNFTETAYEMFHDSAGPDDGKRLGIYGEASEEQRRSMEEDGLCLHYLPEEILPRKRNSH